MHRFDRRSFLTWLATLPVLRRARNGSTQQPFIEVRPTALFQQPDGRKNLLRIAVSGLGAPAARARVTDRRGALVGTAGLLPLGEGLTLTGEVWVPLSQPGDVQIDVEVRRERAGRRRVRFTPECALQVLSYLENRGPEAGDALLQAIRDGKVGFQALFANLLTGLLDHETLARAVWPAGRLSRERGLTYVSAQITDVPGQTATFPMALAASGVKYLASGANPERAVPLLPPPEGSTSYPQVYYWEGPDGSRVLHWRGHHYGDEVRYGFGAGPEEMGRRLSDWLLTHPVFLSRDWQYDLALLYGADWQDNALMQEQLVTNLEEFNRRYTFQRLVPGRAEDFFRELERRHGPRIPVKRGDTGVYWEDGAASTAAELAAFRSAQLAARAAEVIALWDARLEPRDEDAPPL